MYPKRESGNIDGWRYNDDKGGWYWSQENYEVDKDLGDVTNEDGNFEKSDYPRMGD